MVWARHNGQRGLVASWPQFGVPAGLFLANLSILAFSALSGDQFATLGWRVPFALSIILIGVGLWIRLGILETPVFQQLLDEDKIEKAPIIEVFKKQPREIVLSALLRMGQQAPFYIFTAFIFAYAVGTLHMSRQPDLERGFGRVLRFGCQHSAVRSSVRPYRAQEDVPDRCRSHRSVRIPLFGMVDTAIPSAVFIAIELSLIPHDVQYGPQAALIAEAFTPRLRYSGSSLGYQLASVIAGGPAPSSRPRYSPRTTQAMRSRSISPLAQS
jgi:MFS family permease